MIKPVPWSDFVGKYCCYRPGVVKLNNLMMNYSYTHKRKSLVGTLKNVSRSQRLSSLSLRYKRILLNGKRITSASICIKVLSLRNHCCFQVYAF